MRSASTDRGPRTYLRGEAVPLADAAEHLTGSRQGFDDIAIGAPPPVSWLKWLERNPAYSKPPLEVAATGPKAIGIAARCADQVMFVMGAEPGRLRWAVQTARDAAEQAGRDPSELKMGAWILVYPHDDLAVGRALAAPGAATSARFLTINRKITGPVPEAMRATLERVGMTYDMRPTRPAARKSTRWIRTSWTPSPCSDRSRIASSGSGRSSSWASTS